MEFLGPIDSVVFPKEDGLFFVFDVEHDTVLFKMFSGAVALGPRILSIVIHESHHHIVIEGLRTENNELIIDSLGIVFTLEQLKFEFVALNTRLLCLKDSEVKPVVLLIPLFEVSFWVDLLDGRSLNSRLLILVSFVRVSIFTFLAPILSRLSMLVIRGDPSLLVMCTSAPTLILMRRNGLRLFVLFLRGVFIDLMVICLLFPLRGLSFHNLRCAGIRGSDI